MLLFLLSGFQVLWALCSSCRGAGGTKEGAGPANSAEDSQKVPVPFLNTFRYPVLTQVLFGVKHWDSGVLHDHCKKEEDSRASPHALPLLLSPTLKGATGHLPSCPTFLCSSPPSSTLQLKPRTTCASPAQGPLPKPHPGTGLEGASGLAAPRASATASQPTVREALTFPLPHPTHVFLALMLIEQETLRHCAHLSWQYTALCTEKSLEESGSAATDSTSQLQWAGLAVGEVDCRHPICLDRIRDQCFMPQCLHCFRFDCIWQ